MKTRTTSAPPAHPPLGAWLASRDAATHARAREYLTLQGDRASQVLYYSWTEEQEGTITGRVAFTTQIIASFIAAMVVPNAKGFDLSNILCRCLIMGVLMALPLLWLKKQAAWRAFALARELARYDDQRAAQPLLKCWLQQSNKDTPEARDAARKLVYISTEQPDFFGKSLDNKMRRDFRKKLERTFAPRGWRRIFKRARSLSNDQADAWVALLQMLARIGDTNDLASLKRIADTSPSQVPNHHFVQEAARALMTKPITPSLTSSGTIIQGPAISAPLVQRVR